MQIDKSLNYDALTGKSICRIPATFTDNTGNASYADAAKISIYPPNNDTPIISLVDMTGLKPGYYYYPFDVTNVLPGNYMVNFTFTFGAIKQEFVQNVDVIDSLQRGIGVTVVDQTGTPSSKLAALNVANEISSIVLNMPAQAEGNHPIISEIYAEMTREQRTLCGMENWSWLQGNQEIKNFQVLSTVASVKGAAAGIYGDQTNWGAGFFTLANDGQPSKTSYFAEKVTMVDLSSPSTVSVSLAAAGIGIGAPSGTAQLLICSDSSGSPDITTPVFSSDIITPALTGANFTNNLFTFTLPQTALVPTVGYWFVLKYVAAADNGDNLVVNFGATASTTTKTMLNDATIWTSFTTGRIVITFNYFKAEYLTQLTAPATVTEIYALYAGTDSVKTETLLPYSNDRYVNSGDDLPAGTFTVRRLSSGQLVIYTHASTSPLTWIMECRLAPVAITKDTDICLIPDDFINWLVYRCAGNFINRGLGISTQSGDNLLKQAEEIKVDMNFRYLSKQKGRRVIKSGGTRNAFTRINGRRYR